jgi:inner membrane protein
MGYVIYRLAKEDAGQPAEAEKRLGRLPLLLAYTLGVSLLPDLDFVAGILFRDPASFHNNGTHSLVVGLAFSLVMGAILAWKLPLGFVRGFLITLASYGMHVIMDFFTYGGRGVMLFWPLSASRFQSPVLLFYGVRWSDGLFSFQHLITLVTELVFVIAVLLLPKFFPRKAIAPILEVGPFRFLIDALGRKE